MISLKGVRKSYDGREVVAPLDLTIPPGSVAALIGPSGCGKSTILRMVAGLIPPDGGAVALGGEPMTPATAQSLRRRLGYVIQDGGLFPHLTNGANVALMARHLNRPRGETDARLAELCALARFPAEMLDRFPNEVSGGQRQRVGLMRALMLKPEILLLDEPMAALDPLVRAALQDDLKAAFAASGATVILVTHDMGEAAYLAPNDIVLLREGRVVQRGTADDFRARPAEPYVTEFLNAQRGWA